MFMTFSGYISVISHDNDLLIVENDVLSKLAKRFRVVVKSNTKATQELRGYCKRNNITLIDSAFGLGFSANNNYVFKYCRSNLYMSDQDYFLVLNPDVIVTARAVSNLVRKAMLEGWSLSTINLYSDEGMQIPELSIKKFPKILTPVKAVLSRSRDDVYDKSKIYEPVSVDWAAGSFLLFKSSVFSKLDGFNEKYFMYFEDVDLCRRAHAEGMKIMYDPEISAVHHASYKNRDIFSKHFWWYLRSFFRYHLL